MGDRANYAIRENGQVELYYSHWGAVTVAEDVFWGPARTEAFIRSNERTTEWLDDVWAQGGVALDKDNRLLTYYIQSGLTKRTFGVSTNRYSKKLGAPLLGPLAEPKLGKP